MKKRYIFAILVVIITGIFITELLYSSKEPTTEQKTFNIPHFGQKLWKYDIKTNTWSKYENDENLPQSDDVVLQIIAPEDNTSTTEYNVISHDESIASENLSLGESSVEFLTGKSLYSYSPRSFEYFAINFNGFKFVPRKLTEDEVKQLFNGYSIIKVSDIIKNDIKISLLKNNKYIILNDIGEKFYKYFIVPNDSESLSIEDFSNQFQLKNKTKIKLQRLEGCTTTYPCYNITVEK